MRVSTVLCAFAFIITTCAGPESTIPGYAPPPQTAQVPIPPVADTKAAPPPVSGPGISNVTYPSPAHGYTLTLPSTWIAMAPTQSQVNSWLDTVSPPAPDDENRLPDNPGIDYIAVLPADSDSTRIRAQLTASAVCAGGASLRQFTNASIAELESLAGTRILTSTTSYAIRTDSLPVTTVEYTIHEPDHLATGEYPVHGYQAFTYSATADCFVIVTIVATYQEYTILLPDFVSIVAQIELD